MENLIENHDKIIEHHRKSRKKHEHQVDVVKAFPKKQRSIDFVALPRPNPAYPPWRSSLTYVNEVRQRAAEAC